MKKTKARVLLVSIASLFTAVSKSVLGMVLEL